MSTATEVSFSVSADDAALIDKIMDRACKKPRSADSKFTLVRRSDRLNVEMSITACHANGNPLRLADLLAADDFNFAHDVLGIANCIDTETGGLTNLFSPRFSA